jgi:hypothetical protein
MRLVVAKLESSTGELLNMAKQRLSVLKSRVLGQIRQIIKSVVNSGEVKKSSKTLNAITGKFNCLLIVYLFGFVSHFRPRISFAALYLIFGLVSHLRHYMSFVALYLAFIHFCGSLSWYHN